MEEARLNDGPQPPDSIPPGEGPRPHYLIRLTRHGIRNVRRLVVAVVGGTIVLFGIALIVLPGPAFVVIPLGLAVLASEFVWARRLLHHARDWIAQQRDRHLPKRETDPNNPPANE